MFRLTIKGLLGRPKLTRISRANLYRQIWPDPITQQTLDEFLQEINYFDEPKEFINVGLAKPDAKKEDKIISRSDHRVDAKSEGSLDQILDRLAVDVEPPKLHNDDASIHGEQLVKLAIHAGIYRDLFGTYNPNTQPIHFTQKQAERLNRLIGHYWITDRPFSRVDINPKIPEPLSYFNSYVDISAKFIFRDGDRVLSHVPRYGNIIPASEAQDKPSIEIDGELLGLEKSSRPMRLSRHTNWSSGEIRLSNFPTSDNKFYTLALLNLDYLHENDSNLHWMLANMSSTRDGHDEICEYLPTHAIKGFGYSRYVFLLLQHDSPIDSSNHVIEDFTPASRKFNPKQFIDQYSSINIKPVGLSWFQTTWDESCNDIFHKFVKQKAPVYEYVQHNESKRTDVDYPGRVPFNIYLDHVRSKKSINKQVLLDRLKSIDPFDYRDQYVPPRVPATIFEDKNIPSWMSNVLLKKKNKIGYWRGLRPASATLPLDNNADLDYPIRPVAGSDKNPPESPNEYYVIPRRLTKKSPYEKPLEEHTDVFVQEGHDVHVDRKAMPE